MVRLSAVLGVSVRGVPLAEVVLSGPPDAAQAGEFGGAQDGVWHGFRVARRVASGKDTVLFTTEFLRNSTVRPCRGGSDGSRRPGCCHGKKEGSGLRPLPHFSFRRSTSRGPSGPLEHPPKRVRQGKSRQARAGPAGAAGGASSPLPGRLGRLPPSGVLPRKERGVRASDHCPIFLSVGAPAEGRPACWSTRPSGCVKARAVRLAQPPQGPQGG